MFNYCYEGIPLTVTVQQLPKLAPLCLIALAPVVSTALSRYVLVYICNIIKQGKIMVLTQYHPDSSDIGIDCILAS